ncbi:BsuBI/PstI family type II restriction endonuclease [Archangium lansingense]|uniref:BsuBI/PstI family type II restriction endonuclease n=1 Tax=Archangium lansingense TaxID=2995310 RepID=UPI003B79F2EA
MSKKQGKRGFDMFKPEAGKPTAAVKAKVKQAQSILEQLGMDAKRSNVRSALTLLSLLDLKPDTLWSEAAAPRKGVTQAMLFVNEHYGTIKTYKPNTRETVRRQTLHQFVDAGLVELNSDDPKRPTNSKDNSYKVNEAAVEVIRTYGTDEWPERLRLYLAEAPTLREKYAQARKKQMIPVTLTAGIVIRLSPGGQNNLIKDIVEKFCPFFTPGGNVLYVGDAEKKERHIPHEEFAALGVTIDRHGKMPDVVVHHVEKDWLLLIEAVTSHGPVSPMRREHLRALFKGSRAGLVYVTAFPDRHTLSKYLPEISWETEVWVAEAPDHIIHFNGERFLGPYEDEAATG